MRPTPLRLLSAVLVLLITAARGSAAPANYETSKAALDERLAKLRQLYAETDWAATSPAELGRRLGHDPHACAAFLRRAMRYEPYPGVLRGGGGALAAGAGNSADLCLLLRDMLADAEPRPAFRFAAAQLDPAAAAKLVDSAARRPAIGAIVVAPPAGGAEAGAQRQATRPATLPATPAGAADVTSLLSRVDADVKQIEAALGDAAPRSGDDRDVAIEHARRHVWLQVQRDGKWESLDPVAALPLPADARVADELPPEWAHALNVRVELERLPPEPSGKPQRETVIEKHWPTAELDGACVELVIAPAELSVDKLLDPTAASDTLAGQAKKFEKYGVALGPPGAPPEKIVTLTAKPGAAAVTDAEAEKAGPTGIGGGFDPFKRAGTIRGQPPGGGNNPADAKPAVAGEVSGLFVTFTFTGPAGRWAAERPVFDRVGPAARAAGDPLKIADAWADPQRLRVALVQRHQIFVPTGTIGLARVVRDAVGSIAEHQTLATALDLQHGKADPAKALEAVALPSLPADLVAVSDGARSLAEMMSRAGADGATAVFVGSPNLYLRSETLDLADGQATLRAGADLVRNEVTAIGPGAAKARRAHGLLASELEGMSIMSPHGGVAPLWAADVLRAAAAQNVSLRVLREPGDAKDVTTDPDAQVVMAALLARRHVLLVPERPVTVEGASSGKAIAWWTIDDRGHVLATSADGRGQAASEGMLVLTDISIPMVRRCMTFVACLNKSVAGGGAMRQSAGDCLATAIRDYVKDTLDSAIKQFVTSPLQSRFDQAASDQFGEYWELYQKAKEANERFNQAMSAIEDPAGQVPGVDEGRESADAGREIGASLGFRMYLMLTIGRDIAEYASQP